MLKPGDPGYLEENQRPMVYGVCIFFIILPLVIVPLRFYARSIAGAGIWWDDWFALAGVPFALASPIVDIIMTARRTYGWHMAQISPANLEFYNLNIYVVLLFYNPGLAFFKLSLLAFYVRVFPVIRWLRISCYALGSLIIAWVVATQFAFIFRCTPVAAAWVAEAGKCINPTSIFIAQSIPTLVFDISILALPIRTVWGTQLKKSQRVGVISVFMLGGLVTIISVVRLENTLTLTNDDFTWTHVSLGLWSAAEPIIGLLSCSLLTYGPLLTRLRRQFGLTTTDTGKSGSSNTFTRQSGTLSTAAKRSNIGYSRHRDSDTFELNSDAFELTAADPRLLQNRVNIETGESRENIEGGVDSTGKGAIHVTHDVTVYR